MRQNVIGHCVQGAAHIRKSIVCQDAWQHRYLDKDKSSVVVAVSDGHGSSKCPFCSIGSKLAAELFCSMVASLWNKARAELQKQIKKENRTQKSNQQKQHQSKCPSNIAINRLVASRLDTEAKRLSFCRTLVEKWQARVCRNYYARPVKLAKSQKLVRCRRRPYFINADRSALTPSQIHHMYGCTLLGLVVCDDFFMALQIGDGDIALVADDRQGQTRYRAIDQGTKFLGVESYSLCIPQAWKNSWSNLVRRSAAASTKPASQIFFVSTDGWCNSYPTGQIFSQTYLEYADTMKKIGWKAMKDNLPAWLSKTTAMGSGDDVTVVMIASGVKE